MRESEGSLHDVPWLPDPGCTRAAFVNGSIVVSTKLKILAIYVAAYVVLVGSLALADIGLTTHLLEHDVNAFEVNTQVDASTFSTMLGGVSKSLALFTCLFIASFAMCIADERWRKTLQISSRLDEVLIRLPGAAAIWYPIMLTGAALNNGGMILFKYSWLQEMFAIVGLRSADEQRAGFVLYTLISLIVLLTPAYFIFSKIVDRAKRSLPKRDDQT